MLTFACCFLTTCENKLNRTLTLLDFSWKKHLFLFFLLSDWRPAIRNKELKQMQSRYDGRANAAFPSRHFTVARCSLTHLERIFETWSKIKYDSNIHLPSSNEVELLTALIRTLNYGNNIQPLWQLCSAYKQMISIQFATYCHVSPLISFLFFQRDFWS